MTGGRISDTSLLSPGSRQTGSESERVQVSSEGSLVMVTFHWMRLHHWLWSQVVWYNKIKYISSWKWLEVAGCCKPGCFSINSISHFLWSEKKIVLKVCLEGILKFIYKIQSWDLNKYFVDPLKKIIFNFEWFIVALSLHLIWVCGLLIKKFIFLYCYYWHIYNPL